MISKETIRARVERDRNFAQATTRRPRIDASNGDIATAKTILRDYINATVGFTKLAQATRIPSKSLMRMLGPSGTRARRISSKSSCFLQRREGIAFPRSKRTPVELCEL